MEKFKIGFLGSGSIGLKVIDYLFKNKLLELIVTKHDTQAKRGLQYIENPIKQYAKANKIDFFIYDKCKIDELKILLNKKRINMLFVTDFGYIIPEELLDIRYGTIGMHPSLLPDYRGAAPLNWTLINGVEKTGITTYKLDKGIDTGDIIMQQNVEVSNEDDYFKLVKKINVIIDKVLKKTFELLLKGKQLQKQKKKFFFSSYKLNKCMGNILWQLPAEIIHNLVRGLKPWPLAYTLYKRKTVKILETLPINYNTFYLPGTITAINKDSLDIQTGDGILRIFNMQFENKKAMSVQKILNGYKFNRGDRLCRK